MPELNFCPYCDAPRHKVGSVNDKMYFCKACNKFFEVGFVQLKCPKCGSTRYGDSDFPSPNGETIIHCNSCKKMLSIKEFLEKNDVDV